MIKSYQNKIPFFKGDKGFIAFNALLIGDLTIGQFSSFWFYTLARADVAPIVIGDNVNVQDHSVLHVTTNIPLIIEDCVSIGHHVSLHSCIIGKNSLIGIKSTVLDGAVIGEGSVVAASTLVPPGKKYPPFSMIKGSKGEIVRPLTEDEKKIYNNHYKVYLKLSKSYLLETF